jgi:hypothetical protein|tara:strand:+ start:78 stop:383 length:306 start_codon:yes stop_codon:yes gene_type:complete
MKKITMLLIALFSMNIATYAGFPITESGTETIVVIDNEASVETPNYGYDFEWSWLWFAIGFILPLLGILIAMIYDMDMKTSAMAGSLAWLLVLVLLNLMFA